MQVPGVRDYNLHVGMKSYFHDDLIDYKNPLEKEYAIQHGVHIYKKQEEIGYQNSDLNNANIWLFTLEDHLQKLSANEISIYDFHRSSGDSNIYSNLIENLDPERLTRTQREFLEVPSEDNKSRLKFFQKRSKGIIYMKYELWKALDFERTVE